MGNTFLQSARQLESIFDFSFHSQGPLIRSIGSRGTFVASFVFLVNLRRETVKYSQQQLQILLLMQLENTEIFRRADLGKVSLKKAYF